MSEAPEPAKEVPVYWSQLMRRWARLSGPQRRSYLSAITLGLSAAWRQAADMASLPPELWAFARDEQGRLRAYPPRRLTATVPAPLAPAEWADVLVGWMQAARRWLTPREIGALIDRLLRQEPLSRAHRRHVLRNLERRARAAQRDAARALYAEALTHPRIRTQGARTGCWLPDPGVDPAALAQELARAVADPATQGLKQSAGTTVLRTTVFGKAVILKRYDHPSAGRRLKYWGRASRARRAWAAAHTLIALRLPTAEPLGLLEEGRGATSYLLMEDLQAARSLFDWLHAEPAARAAAPRRDLADDLFRAWTDLNRSGLYHADTKLSNLLVFHPEDGAQRAFYWIDLECLQAGVRMSRRRVLRNLVQMNGSLRDAASLRERLHFLHRVAADHPWVLQRGTMARIASWTARRLEREDRGLCGP